MIAIPNMEKPKNCAECFYGLRCKAVPRWITTDDSIPKGCPLIEIVTCGECKYEYSCGQQIKRNGLTLKLTGCEYGERRAE